MQQTIFKRRKYSMRTSTTVRKKTKYQILVSRKKAFCTGKATKADVKRAASEYIKNAVEKAKKTKTPAAAAKSKATSTAQRVLTRGCKMSAVISKRKPAMAKKRVVKK